jgi:hypothetical protein
VYDDAIADSSIRLESESGDCEGLTSTLLEALRGRPAFHGVPVRWARSEL